MVSQLVSTKWMIPPSRSQTIRRGRLADLLNEGVSRKLTLVSAPAGYGKTTLVSDWLLCCGIPAAWLSLDEADNDRIRFLTYLIEAIAAAPAGEPAVSRTQLLLQSSPSPQLHMILTTLISDLTKLPEPLILVLEDYHVITNDTIHPLISFLLNHMPSHVHLIIITRHEPNLPLARLRITHEVKELYMQDLQFTYEEADELLNGSLRLGLSKEKLSALVTQTEGWPAALYIAAVSIRGMGSRGIDTCGGNLFLGSPSLLLDYLMEEVLDKQPESRGSFLLYTSVLDRLCGDLCDAVLGLKSPGCGEQVLKELERAHLFIIPLDTKGHWYRYHPLFAEVMRRRLEDLLAAEGVQDTMSDLHIRASLWYSSKGLLMEAFHHAAAARDDEMAAKLAEGTAVHYRDVDIVDDDSGGMPLHLYGEPAPILNWLESLPKEVFRGRPSLWIVYGSVLLMTGRFTEMEEKLQAAEEAARKNPSAVPISNNMLGLLAATRAALAAIVHTPSARKGTEDVMLHLQAAEDAVIHKSSEEMTGKLVGMIAPAYKKKATSDSDQLDSIIKLASKALEYLSPKLLPVRLTMRWLIGVAYQLRGDYDDAKAAYLEIQTQSRKLGGGILGIMSEVGLGNVLEANNRLYEAAENYQRALRLARELPIPIVCEAYLGLARIYLEWKDLDSAARYVQVGTRLALEVGSVDLILSFRLIEARIMGARGEWAEADRILAECRGLVRSHLLPNWLIEIAEVEQSVASQASDRLVEPLSQREREVLQLVASGLSNQEIAQKLYLALDTVKGINRRIFSKLQVERRTEAVAVARSLGWIE